MNNNPEYDIIIVGGGLAGLSLAIQFGRMQYKVLVLEKESYPKHKVCGEYISMESRPFLESLGVPLDSMQLPFINKLMVTDTRGNVVNETLPQGGFGISRYKLDELLAALAVAAGATLLTKTRAENIVWQNDAFTVTARGQEYTARVVCGTWGKRSNMDVKWQRPFVTGRNSKLNNYIAIKYHISYPWPADCVGLHNFNNGYCGISRVEDDRTCICYLTTAANLRKSGNDIKTLEREIVMQNPWLREIFTKATFLYDAPVAISQISFEDKARVEEHALLLGDAAGMITPLCGNGMSMALNASKIAAGIVNEFLQGRISRSEMEQRYTLQWQKLFTTRVRLGRFVQGNCGKDWSTSFFLKALNAFPILRKTLIKGTSGKPF